MPEQTLTLESIRSTLATMANVLYDQVKPDCVDPPHDAPNIRLVVSELDKLVDFINGLSRVKT